MTTPAASSLDALVRRVRGLYTMPAVAVEVLSLADDPRADAARLKACIERDPALVAKLLRVVNSSLFGLTRKVTDLNQAIALLGVKPLKLLVLSFSLPERLLTGDAGDLLEHYWRRTLTRAVAARELAQAARVSGGDEAFVAGLLADLGILVLLEEEGECYQPLYRLAQTGEVELLAAERKTFGFDHAQLTIRLLNAWNLPRPIVVAVEQLGAASGDAQAAASDAARLLRTAERLTALVVDERTEVWPDLQAEAEQAWRLSTERLAALAASLDEQVTQLAGVMQLAVSSAERGRRLMTDAHRLLCEQTEAALAGWLKPPRDVAAGPRPAMQAADEASTAVASAKAAGPSLTAGLRAAAVECRANRVPLTLCLIEIHAATAQAAMLDEAVRRRIGKALVDVCRAVERPSQLFGGGDAQIALVWPDCDRAHALGEVDDLLRRVRSAWRGEADDLTVGVGVAVLNPPPRGFAIEELVKAAERCLFAAAHAAGDNAKSIELF